MNINPRTLHEAMPRGVAMVSVNERALRIVRELLGNSEYYNVKVSRLSSGATVVDTGLEAKGGYEIGLKLIEIAIGGLGSASLIVSDYDGLLLPTVVVRTDHPAVALLGCQLAGWSVKVKDFFGMGSGPARALALKPKKVFEKIGYKEEYDKAVLLLEAKTPPTDEVALEVSRACNVRPEDVHLVLTTVNSIAGSVQVAGRVAETGLYRLDYLGFDVKKVVSAVGEAPVMPLHPDENVTLGRQEDSLIYGGRACYVVDFKDEDKLIELLKKAPATVSPYYGKPSYEVLKGVNFNWSKLDPAFFTIGLITAHNLATGRALQFGSINPEGLKKALI